MSQVAIYIPPGPTLSRFHASNARRRLIIGPIGSGKSTACCWELMKRARDQRPNREGVRRSRWAVIRNTYGELKLTTIKTWEGCFSQIYGGPSGNGPIIHRVRDLLDDSSRLDAEFVFLSMDKPQDTKKLLSLEITGGWVNESRELPRTLFEHLDDRCGRFPPASEEGCSWTGWIADTNPPDQEHWMYQAAEELIHAEPERWDGWEFYRQPGGVRWNGDAWVENPAAENTANLEPGYYRIRMSGKSQDHIKVYLAGEYGFVQEGKPVIHEYNDSLHCPPERLEFTKGLPVYVGLDFGLWPAAALLQQMPSGQWRWIEEICTENMGAVTFSQILKPRLDLLAEQGFEFRITGDPAGDAMVQTDEQTVFQVLRARGIPAFPAYTNDLAIRRDVLGNACSRLIDGRPGFLISPTCTVARKGLAQGYCFRQLRIFSGNEARYQEYPDKNRYSHIIEAGQYAMMGAGAGREITVAKRLRRRGSDYRGRKDSDGSAWSV